MKNLLWKQPGLDRLICVLVASVALFLVQIIMSHITHSLTLLAAAYHMLYNIFSLVGCITTIKVFNNSYFQFLVYKMYNQLNCAFQCHEGIAIDENLRT